MEVVMKIVKLEDPTEYQLADGLDHMTLCDHANRILEAVQGSSD
jgi:hypothetical protein